MKTLALSGALTAAVSWRLHTTGVKCFVSMNGGHGLIVPADVVCVRETTVCSPCNERGVRCLLPLCV